MSKASELRDRGTDELNALVAEMEQEQFKLQFQHRTQQLENTAKLVSTRRQIARIKTVLRQRDQAGQSGEKS